MEKPVKVNKRCLVRNQECKRKFSGSRICFVACPDNTEIGLELDIIKKTLRSVNIEPYIAVDKRELQKDIFCEKICSKIIESNFCIVILNDVKDKADDVRKPNANVYYEYGLMTAFGKRIIPIQIDGHNLAFNIQSLDTIKYDKSNFPKQMEEAIRLTLLKDNDVDIGDTEGSGTIEWVIDVLGLVRFKNQLSSTFMETMKIDSLGFSLYINPDERQLVFICKFTPDISNNDVLFRLKIFNLRVSNYINDLLRQIEDDLYDLIPVGEGLHSSTQINGFIDDLMQSKIAVLKENIEDVNKFIASYKVECSELANMMDIQIINAEKAREIIRS